MLRCVSRPFPPSRVIKTGPTARYFHRVAADFIDYATDGKPISTRESIIVGNPEETYVLIPPEVGRALQAGSLRHNPSAYIGAEHKCKLTFFHDSQHFGFGELSILFSLSPPNFVLFLESSNYPRLHIPRNFPRQEGSNTSPATLFLNAQMHEIALDGTFDGKLS